MPYGITAVLVHPRIGTGKIVVPDLLLRLHVMVQFDGIGSTTVESVLAGPGCVQTGWATEDASITTARDLWVAVVAIGLRMVGASVLQGAPAMVGLVVGASVLAQLVVRT